MSDSEAPHPGKHRCHKPVGRRQSFRKTRNKHQNPVLVRFAARSPNTILAALPSPAMHTIYRKTPLGVAEIESRAMKIPQRLRSLLIMIDGKRTAASLAAMAQAEQCIAELHAQGLIEPAAAPAPAPTPVPPRLAKPAVSFETNLRLIVRELNDAVGPAAETLAIKMERTRNVAELRALLPHALQVVSAMRGRAFCEAFASRVERALA